VALRPGDTLVKKLIMIDPAQAWGYKFSYTFKCLEEVASEAEVLNIVRRQGQVKRFKYQGEE